MRGEQMNFFSGGEDSKLLKRRYGITLPVDTLILVSVVIMLLIIIAFSWGVERGRKIASLTLAKQQADSLVEFNGTLANATAKAYLDINNETTVKPLKPVAQARPQKNNTTQSQDQTGAEKDTDDDSDQIDGAEGNYVIQVGSYVTESAAQREAKKLKDNGYNVDISQKGKYVVIFVGDYKNKQDAQKNVDSLKKRYKDCFIKSNQSKLRRL